jgi:hypothetical protein
MQFEYASPGELKEWLVGELEEAGWSMLSEDKANEFLSRARELIYTDLTYVLRETGICWIHRDVEEAE